MLHQALIMTEGEAGVRRDNEDDKHATEIIVFRSRWKHIKLLWATMGFAVFVPIFLFAHDPADRPALLGSIFSASFVVLFVVPTSISVRSDASVGVSTLAFTYRFHDVTSESHRPTGANLCSGVSESGVRFPGDPFNRVVVVRQGRNWNLLVSPQDPDGLVRAVRSVAEAASSIIVTTPRTTTTTTTTTATVP